MEYKSFYFISVEEIVLSSFWVKFFWSLLKFVRGGKRRGRKEAKRTKAALNKFLVGLDYVYSIYTS